ncbi:Arm DNA-binding domain-containing protein [Chitinophaga sp.]|uniref:Arm DNA-binding domain-containing protein n=1 Tax=Chitinophaga sp. TaxID=1869181 RepID=UPI003454DFA5
MYDQFFCSFPAQQEPYKKHKPAIYLRVSLGGKRAELSTYQYVTPALWNASAHGYQNND